MKTELSNELTQEIEKTQKIIRDYCNHSRFFKIPETKFLREVDKLLETTKKQTFKIGE